MRRAERDKDKELNEQTNDSSLNLQGNPKDFEIEKLQR